MAPIYTIVSTEKNKKAVDHLALALKNRGYTAQTLCNEHAHPEAHMKAFQALEQHCSNDPAHASFREGLDAILSSETVIFYLPAREAAHLEIGIAYGRGKRCVLIGTPEMNPSVYCLFKERYKNEEAFLESLSDSYGRDHH